MNSLKIATAFASALALTQLTACGGAGGSGTPVAEGDDIRFSLSWQGPADMDLMVLTPGGRRVSFETESADGCTLGSNEGGTNGPLEEVIVCRNLLTGTYEATVVNNEESSVSVEMETSSGGTIIDQRGLSVGGLDMAGPFRVRVPSEEPTPAPTRGASARLRDACAANCTVSLDACGEGRFFSEYSSVPDCTEECVSVARDFLVDASDGERCLETQASFIDCCSARRQCGEIPDGCDSEFARAVSSCGGEFGGCPLIFFF